ncbi:class I adenylate-forming enzyme family protein [Pueribacillus sp. YX66]|uniref:class I adenylate-forming enzyme family protein n=1 Tax=Pueribacillus sp. YX66 TaxID=3229242 RepID=UPI00358D06A6
MKTYRNRPSSLVATLKQSAERFPNKVALVHGNDRVTYAELNQKVNNVAYTLKHSYGIQKGDTVALLLMNGIPFVISVYAALQIGAIAVPLNTKLKSNELFYMIENSNAKVLMTNEEWWPQVEVIKEKLKIEAIFVTNIRPPKGTISFASLVNNVADEDVFESISEDDAAFIMYTSGTTGKPKGALISHRNMLHTCLNYTYCYRLTSDDSTLIAVPVFHITGLAAQLMTFIYLGGKTVLMPMFHPNQFLQLLEREKITHVIASPTVYVMTLMEKNDMKYDVSNWRVCAFGGAPMPVETLQALKSWVPSLELHNTYGLTETTSPATIMPDGHQLRKIQSVGVLTPVTEAKVVDPMTRRELPTNEIGELLFKGPMVIEKYWNNEKATKETIIDGWLATGDLAYMDEEGFITIMDRMKDMINRGGEKIYSVEVEDVLYSHPSILEAAIVGVEDKKYGEIVKACIVVKPNKFLTEADVKQWISKHLAKYKVPAYVEFFEQLPRNPNGKVIKTALRYVPEQSK